MITFASGDQICFILGHFDAREGRQVGGVEQVIYGAYRVKRAYFETSVFNSRPQLELEPHPDGWALLPQNMVRKPATPAALVGISYLRRISERTAADAVREAVLSGQDAPPTNGWASQWQRRLERLEESYNAGCKAAEQKWKSSQFRHASSDFRPGSRQ